MNPPRKPRGEKPATTIRLLRRQLHEMAIAMGDLRSKITISELAQREAEERSRGTEIESDFLTEQLSACKADNRALEADLLRQDHRLAFLEGYYAKSTENLRHAIPIEIVGGRRSGDPEDFPRGQEDRPQERPQEHAARHVGQDGGSVRRHETVAATDSGRRTVEEESRQAGAAQDFHIGEARDGPIRPRRVNRTYPLPDGALYRR